MTNLSNYSRSYSDLRVLSIGLKFNPSPTHVERLILKEFLRRLDRKLRLREYFAESDSPVDSDTINFSNLTTETPPPSRIEAKDMYLFIVDSELKNAPEQNTAPSLTADERQVLRYPKRNTEAAIRESVKVSDVTIMSRKRYIAEAYRLLRDTDVYQQVSSD